MYKRFILILLLFTFFAVRVNAQVRIRVTVDATIITLNETIGFKIEAINAEGAPSVNITPILKDFTIVSGPAQQTNIQWVNGKMTSSRSLTWTILPKRSGYIIIPPLDVSISGKSYQTASIEIQVKKSGSISQLTDVFIHVELDKEQAYPGEQVTVTYKLFTKVNLTIEDLHYPTSVGFWTEDLRVAQTIRFRDTKIKDVLYKSATLYKAALFPTKTGKLVISPMVVIANVEIPRQRRRGSMYNDPFFNNMFRETKKQYITSDSLIINVEPLPSGQPVNFTGAVGEFFIESSLDTNQVKVNEAVTFRVIMKGTGNINLFNLPEIKFPQNIEVFPPTSTFKKDELRDQVTGEITWDYILIPRTAGLFRLPKPELPYFNPRDNSWEIAKTKSYILRVHPSNQDIVATARFQKKNVELLGQDIHYIRTEVPKWRQKGDTGISAWVWSSYALAAFIFVLPGFITKSHEGRLATVDSRQSKSALKRVRKKLSKLKNDPFTHIPRIIFTYAKEKLILHSDKMDALKLAAELKGIVSEDNIKELVLIIKSCDAGRFAPDKNIPQKTLKMRTMEILKKIDRELS